MKNKIKEQTDIMMIDSSQENHEKLIIKVFYANWCIPSKQLLKTIDKVKEDYSNVIFELLNIDKEDELTKKYNVKASPTIFFEKNDKNIDYLMGAHNEIKIKEMIDKWLFYNPD